MSLELETVHKVAALARLKLSDQEATQLQTELGQILHHMEQLDGVDTSNVEPLSHAADVANSLREDIKHSSIDREQALANAPDQDGEHFLVPPVFGSDS